MSANIIIIGAGLAGAATAYHLRRLGVEGVVVLEQEAAPGQHSSGRNAAMVRAHVEDADVRVLTGAGAAELASGRLAEFRATGGFLIGPGSDDVAAHVPLAVGTGRWCPHDGVTDPAGLLQTYLRGADVRCNVRVDDWKQTSTGIQLSTSAGEMRARRLVNAAGPWAGAIGRIPLSPLNRHLLLTPPLAEVNPAWPYVWDVAHGLYFRPEGGGLLLCPCDEHEREPGDYQVDFDVHDRLASLLSVRQPQLADLPMRMCWAGQRTFAADRKFVVGYDPRCSALFHVAGLGGHGVTASFALGRLAAELLVAGEPNSGNPFDPQRLLRGSLSAARCGLGGA